LRRQTAIARSLLERTRGDLTISMREEHLEQVIRSASERLDRSLANHADDPGL
jgi:translin